MTLDPGATILDGKYRIEALVGHGAFGKVYRARHVETDEVRAVKVVRKDAPAVGSTVFDVYRDRFKLEFQLAARVENPNVIAVYDLVEESDAVYAVMEYASGGSVADLIAAVGQLPVNQALGILLDCARGLEALHTQGAAVHRDVKPANILLSADGTAKVADFGLAQVGGSSISLRSELGSLASPHPGTPNYMSPEHRYAEPLGPTSDVYSLGCVAFEMLTGRTWRLVQHTASKPRDLRDEVPGWLDEVVVRMLCDMPGTRLTDTENVTRRYVTMGAVETAIVDGQKHELAGSAFSQAMTHNLEGDHKAAIIDLVRAIGIDPENATYYLACASARLSNGESEAAIADCTMAIELDPTWASSWGLRGGCHKLLGRADAALSDYSMVVQLDPEHAHNWYCRGRLYYDQRQYEAAVNDFAEALRIEPDSGLYQLSLKYAEQDKSRQDRVDQLNERLLEESGNARLWYYLGRDHEGQGDKLAAIADYTRAIELDPTNADYWYRRSFPHMNTRDNAAAIVDLTRAVELNALMSVYWAYRGHCYEQICEFDAAIRDYSTAIDLEPTMAWYWSGRAACHRANGHLESAIEDYSMAINTDHTSPWRLCDRGDCYHEAGRLDDALIDHSNSITLAKSEYPDSLAKFHSHRAADHRAMRHFDEALADDSQAIEFAPKNGMYYHSRSLTHRARGDTDLADADLACADDLGYVG